jgi:hypothetical protein
LPDTEEVERGVVEELGGVVPVVGGVVAVERSVTAASGCLSLLAEPAAIRATARHAANRFLLSLLLVTDTCVAN